MPMTSEMRAPYRRRERMSRPKQSVPSQVLGGRRPELVEDVLVDADRGARATAPQMAARATIRKMTSPTHEVLLALKALTVALAM